MLEVIARLAIPKHAQKTRKPHTKGKPYTKSMQNNSSISNSDSVADSQEEPVACLVCEQIIKDPLKTAKIPVTKHFSVRANARPSTIGNVWDSPSVPTTKQASQTIHFIVCFVYKTIMVISLLS